MVVIAVLAGWGHAAVDQQSRQPPLQAVQDARLQGVIQQLADVLGCSLLLCCSGHAEVLVHDINDCRDAQHALLRGHHALQGWMRHT